MGRFRWFGRGYFGRDGIEFMGLVVLGSSLLAPVHFCSLVFARLTIDIMGRSSERMEIKMKREKLIKVVRAIVVYVLGLALHLFLSIIELDLGLRGVFVLGNNEWFLITVGIIGLILTPILSYGYWLLLRTWDFNFGD